MRRRFDFEGNGFLILWIIACIAAVAVGVSIFIAVINSDMPDWLKFLILK